MDTRNDVHAICYLPVSDNSSSKQQRQLNKIALKHYTFIQTMAGNNRAADFFNDLRNLVRRDRRLLNRNRIPKQPPRLNGMHGVRYTKIVNEYTIVN